MKRLFPPLTPQLPYIERMLFPLLEVNIELPEILWLVLLQLINTA